jgi:hypothetical protein
MNVLAVDDILSEVSKFPLPDKEMIVEILEKRLIDEKRDFISREYKKALKDYRAGEVKIGSVDDLFGSHEEVY